MKIFIICSKKLYKEIDKIKERLENELGHEVVLPILYGRPEAAEEAKEKGPEFYADFKRNEITKSAKAINECDAVLCLNFERQGHANYIGSGMFIELLQAFNRNKRIFIWNYVPEGLLYNEIMAYNPVIIKKRLRNIV